MAFRYALTFIAGLAAVLAAPAAPAQQVEGIAAVVNDEPITTLDVRDRMRLIISSAGVQPTEDMLERIQDQAIRGLVDETLQLQTAREFELEVDEREVDASLSDIAARSGATIADIEADLAQSGIAIETLRHQLRAEIAWQVLVGGRYRARIRISDQQIETALERLALAAAQPQFRLAEIFVEITPEGGEDRAIATIQTIYDQLRNGAPFPAVARQFSDAPSAVTGGDTGYLSAAALRPQVLAAAEQLQAGGISQPLRVPGGYQVVALIDRREGQVVEQLTLTQLTVPASRVTLDSRSTLAAIADRISSCDSIDAQTEGVDGLIVTDLGAIGANALIPQIRDALAGLEAGDATAVLDTAAGLQVFVVCGRELTGPGVPTADEIENQLVNQQLSLLSRRWLRDLRRDATIEIR